MKIEEIRRIVELLKKANCENYATVSEVAKEMGVKKTTLMQFIEDNHKLFSIGEVFKDNTKTPQGMAIFKVYLSSDENPNTEEWLDKMKSEWKNKIHIGQQTYYGVHEYWFIPEDDPKSALTSYAKFGLYRNTPEKIKYLVEKGIIKKIKDGYGGLSDYHRTEYYPYNGNVEKALKEIGWSTDFVQNK